MSMNAVALALTCLALLEGSRAAIDADKAAELSREIREHFRQTGANWVSPKMFQELNLTHNAKPIIFVSTSRSCADCRDFMTSWGKLDKVMVSTLTAQFLSVLVLDDYIFEMERWSPPEIDYLPRVLFAEPNGKLKRDFKNKHVDQMSPYYYENAEQVVEAMQDVLARHWEDLGTDVFQGDLTEDIP